MTPLDALGWTATTVFVGSYFARDPRTLRLMQAGGALLWLAYGLVLQALPVIVANLIVASVAVVSSRQESAAGSRRSAASSQQ